MIRAILLLLTGTLLGALAPRANLSPAITTALAVLAVLSLAAGWVGLLLDPFVSHDRKGHHEGE